jgi:tRNA 2-thiouridine synthesizing protein B
MILHKISSSPFSHLALQHCLQRIHNTDGLLLTQDAVYALMHQTIYAKLTELHAVYVLKDDLEARGVRLENNNIQIITYAEFVELSLKYDNVISW